MDFGRSGTCSTDTEQKPSVLRNVGDRNRTVLARLKAKANRLNQLITYPNWLKAFRTEIGEFQAFLTNSQHLEGTGTKTKINPAFPGKHFKFFMMHILN